MNKININDVNWISFSLDLFYFGHGDGIKDFTKSRAWQVLRVGYQVTGTKCVLVCEIYIFSVQFQFVNCACGCAKFFGDNLLPLLVS